MVCGQCRSSPVRFLARIGSLLFRFFWNYSTERLVPCGHVPAARTRRVDFHCVGELVHVLAMKTAFRVLAAAKHPAGSWPSTPSGRRQVPSSHLLQLPLALKLRTSRPFTVPSWLSSGESVHFLGTWTPTGSLPSVKVQLKQMVEDGIIKKVEEPTLWCSVMVVIPKPNGTVRICVDLTNLNKSIEREKLVLPSVEETLGHLSGTKVFSKLN